MHVSLLVAALLTVVAAGSGNSAPQKVKLTVYYETLCPDSMRFIKKLYDDYPKIADQIELNLVPFGKASWDRQGENLLFTCQHGRKECFGNQIHACAIAKLPLCDAFEFVHCAMSDLWRARSPNMTAVHERCANKQQLDYAPIAECATGRQGQEMLLEAGKLTKSLHPRLDFVPTVVLNNQYSAANQRTALYYDLVDLVGRAFAKAN